MSKYTHVVQAMTGALWVDCRYCVSVESADTERNELINSADGWMNSPTIEERTVMTRVWPIEAANCYLRLQADGRA